MRARDGVVMLVHDEMVTFRVLVALVEVFPGGDGKTRDLDLGVCRTCALVQSCGEDG